MGDSTLSQSQAFAAALQRAKQVNVKTKFPKSAINRFVTKAKEYIQNLHVSNEFIELLQKNF